MLAPSMILLLVFIVYPIIANIVRSFRVPGGEGFSLENYSYFFTDRIQRANTLYTLYIVIVTVLLAVLLAFGLALYLRFSHSRAARILQRLYILPRFIPGLVAVNGMITVIRDSGLINRIGQLFGQNWTLGLMYDACGIITMNLWFNLPFAALLLSSALSGIPDSTIEAARDVGAGPLTILRSMILPLSVRDLLIAATFVFMSNLGSFTTPYLMGSTHPQMLGISLFAQFNNGRYERAAALSVIMFVLSGMSAATYIYTNLKRQAWEQDR